jgi:hypothetical protein
MKRVVIHAIGKQIKFVLPRLIHSERSLIVNAKPLSPAGYSGNAGGEKAGVNPGLVPVHISWRWIFRGERHGTIGVRKTVTLD